jgi:hypothetical protein
VGQEATIVSKPWWISHALDRVHATLDRLDSRFDHVERSCSGITASESDGSKPPTTTEDRG